MGGEVGEEGVVRDSAEEEEAQESAPTRVEGWGELSKCISCEGKERDDLYYFSAHLRHSMKVILKVKNACSIEIVTLHPILASSAVWYYSNPFSTNSCIHAPRNHQNLTNLHLTSSNP